MIRKEIGTIKAYTTETTVHVSENILPVKYFHLSPVW